MSDFEQLVQSRQQWLHHVLIPWCREASLKDLRRAEREWMDIAGKVDPQATLWMWAWERFPGLVVNGLPGVDETYAVTVTLRNGDQFTGFPDGRRSRGAHLLLVGAGGDATCGPFSIDDVASVVRTEQ